MTIDCFDKRVGQTIDCFVVARTLWSDIPCLQLHPASISSIVTRSRGLPVRILLDGYKLETSESQYHSSLVNWLTPSICRRATALTISNLWDASVKRWLKALETRPMPRLQSFHFPTSNKLNDPTGAMIHPSTFGGKVDALSKLHLAEFVIPWTSPLLSKSLILLDLELYQRSTGVLQNDVWLPSVEQFVNVLSAMRSLKELHLRNIFPDAQPAHPWSLTLPNSLTNCSLVSDRDRTRHCLDLHEHLVFPSTTKTVVNLTNPDEIEEDALSRTMTLYFHPSTASQSEAYGYLILSRCCIGIQYRFQPRTYPFTSRIPESYDNWTSYPKCIGSRGIFVDYPGRQQSLLSMVPHLPLTQMCSIICAYDICALFTSIDAWASAFIHAKAVRQFAIPLAGCSYLFDALYETREGGEGEGRFRLFPRLESLYLHDRPAFTKAKKPDLDSNLRTVLEVGLADFLRIRQEMGATVLEVSVAESMKDWDIWDDVASMKQAGRVTFFSV